MANEQNLRKFEKGKSSEEARENGRKGGIKSGETRSLASKMKKALKKVCLWSNRDEIKEKLMLETGCTNEEALLQAIMYGAIVQGNPNDKQLLLKMIGEDKPKDEKEADNGVKVTINLCDTSGEICNE